MSKEKEALREAFIAAYLKWTRLSRSFASFDEVQNAWEEYVTVRCLWDGIPRKEFTWTGSN